MIKQLGHYIRLEIGFRRYLLGKAIDDLKKELLIILKPFKTIVKWINKNRGQKSNGKNTTNRDRSI